MIIRDVAARAAVSVATASKALNERCGVSADTARRVQEAAAELCYESNFVDRSGMAHRAPHPRDRHPRPGH